MVAVDECSSCSVAMSSRAPNAIDTAIDDSERGSLSPLDRLTTSSSPSFSSSSSSSSPSPSPSSLLAPFALRSRSSPSSLVSSSSPSSSSSLPPYRRPGSAQVSARGRYRSDRGGWSLDAYRQVFRPSLLDEAWLAACSIMVFSSTASVWSSSSIVNTMRSLLWPLLLPWIMPLLPLALLFLSRSTTAVTTGEAWESLICWCSCLLFLSTSAGRRKCLRPVLRRFRTRPGAADGSSGAILDWRQPSLLLSVRKELSSPLNAR